jgi:kynurenine formamidase
VIVDIVDEMEDWAVIKPRMITERAEVKKGDILIYHTGYHRYYNGRSEEDEERYFLRHPGGDREFAEWIVEMEFAWTGFDCGSGDHPMNTSIRHKRPDVRKAYEKQIGKDVNDVFPEEDLFVMHRVPFQRGITHVENMGGDIEDALGKRCLIGAFPIPIEGGEASPCRVVAFVDE